MTEVPTSLVHILQWRAVIHPKRLAFRFLPDGDPGEELLTYEDLDRRAQTVARQLQFSVKEGDRVILLFQPGMDFIIAFFACLYARVIAVPAYPPHPARLETGLPLIRRISADTEAAALLMNSSLYEILRKRSSATIEFAGMKMIVPDRNDKTIIGTNWQLPGITGDDIAFLQYTSGSTALPKGVIVRHNNLIDNLGIINKWLEITEEDRAIFWLPPYHDMGLIGGILQPIYAGASFTLMPPLTFLQQPIRWLQAITRFKARISGAPNFAYHHCLKKIKPEQREQLNLESWNAAFNGAEPIYHKTLEQFIKYFAPCGFRKEAFTPCYGLAESTLFVSGSELQSPPVINNFLITGSQKATAVEVDDISENIETMVSCGKVKPDQHIEIVNINTKESCLPGEVGEIWVSGNSVSTGYWNKPAESEFTFSASLSNETGKSFLRTGDLGFIHNDELYVTGRLKNMIISEGKNHYSHDIERTVEASHAAIRMSGCAAFSIRREEHEELVIVAELEYKSMVNEEEIFTAIRNSVSLTHGLKVNEIKLTRPGSIPKTTSGKIKHFLCRQYYLEGAFKEIEAI